MKKNIRISGMQLTSHLKTMKSSRNREYWSQTNLREFHWDFILNSPHLQSSGLPDVSKGRIHNFLLSLGSFRCDARCFVAKAKFDPIYLKRSHHFQSKLSFYCFDSATETMVWRRSEAITTHGRRPWHSLLYSLLLFSASASQQQYEPYSLIQTQRMVAFFPLDAEPLINLAPSFDPHQAR
jgi:hypothetical protein